MKDLIVYANGIDGGYGSKEWDKIYPNTDEIKRAVEFIKIIQFKKLKRPNQQCSSSYSIKHIAEAFLRLKYNDY